MNFVSLILLGFVLGLDSFRVSAGLGSLNLSPSRRKRIALAFGLCDAIAPLVGIAIGHSVIELTGRWTAIIGPLVLSIYGLYVLYLGWQCKEFGAADNDLWLFFGIPVSLSLDNLVAGLGIGMLGFPLLLSVLIIGIISGLMSLAGMRLGSVMGKYLPLRAEMLSGVALICMALILALE
jgi:putative Mn2+ efflux pump MntP